MWKRNLAVLAALLLSYPAVADAGVRLGIGIGVGIPIGGYGYYGYGYPYAYPYPYYAPYAYPAPVVVSQPQYVVPGGTVYPQAVPGYQQSVPGYQQSAPMAPSQPMPPPTTAAVVGTPPSYATSPPIVAGSSPVPITNVVQSSHDNGGPGADAMMQRLSQGDENVRRDAAMDLGRMKAEKAVDILCALLAQDSSPVVRDAAARALGLIGSTRALTPLIRAAQADNDRDVRHSAQFAVEVIRSQLRR